MMIKKYIIKEQECGCLMKDGRFVEMLTAGKYSYLDMLGYEVQTVPMTGEVTGMYLRKMSSSSSI